METDHGRDPGVDNKLPETSIVDNRLSEPLEEYNNLSEPVLVTDIESRKPQHMAFTIHFEDTNKNNITTKSIQERLSNFALKHRRNQSLPTTEENKITKGEVNSALAVNSSQRTANSLPLVVNSSPPNINSPPLALNSSALPVNKTVARRAGYHSEGYFSSDQEEDLRNRSGFFVRKLKNLEKGLKTTNLAQEKINMADQTSQTKLNNSPHMSRHEFGDFHTEGPITLRTRLDELKRQNSNPTNNAVTFNPLDDEELSKDEWLMASTIDDSVETPAIDNGNVMDDGDVENELSNDTASEAGTYTIERDLACPEEDQARKEIDQAVARREDPKVEDDFKMSSYRNGTNWINDWATQVAKHNHHQEPEPLVSGLPPLPVDKHKAPSMTTRIPSPIHSPNIALPPTGRRSNAPPSPTRTHHRSPVHLPPPEGADRHSDSSLETESYLRATESVVTAMQARMSLSLDSGGESDGDASHGFKPVERGRSAVDRHQLQRRSSGMSEGSPRHLRTGQSDSSSEASELKTKKEDPPPTLSLRRARLDCDPVPAPLVDNRKKKTESVSITAYNPPKKTVEPPRPNIPLHTRAIKASSPKPEPTKTFSRTDCGRFSVRAPKAVPQSQAPYTAKPNTVVKKDAKDSKKSGGRSNSTLSSREVEFQNWKRRKSYDPMKAAAEGKKKDAAKKATFNNSMTQSYTTAEETSPSHQSSVLRSASFHGTLGMAPKYTSSEDEVTLSAEEEEEEEDEDSPTTEYPVPLPPVLGSPSKSLLDGAIGGSRVSLHSSTASNSSLKGRTKPEALDSLVMAALSGLSNKLRGRSCILLKKLRILYEEDPEKSEQLSAIIEVLEGPANPCSPQGKSASKELSDTLKNLKRLESFVSVLDEVLFDDEDFDDLDADKLQ